MQTQTQGLGLVFLSLVTAVCSADGAFAQSREIPIQTVSTERALVSAEASGYVAQTLEELRSINAKPIRLRQFKNHPGAVRQERFFQVIDSLIAQMKSGKKKMTLFHEETIQLLREIKRSHMDCKFNLVEVRINKAKEYAKENFFYMAMKEVENLYIERKILLQHYNSTFEWPMTSLHRFTDVIRSYHDGSLAAYGELPATSPYVIRAQATAEKVSKVAKYQLQAVHVIDTPQVGAYCLGQSVYVTRGIMDLYGTYGDPHSSDLGVVIGHEISHIKEEHGARKLVKQGLAWFATYNVASWVVLRAPVEWLVNPVRRALGKEDLESFGEWMENTMLSRYSIGLELEADEFGMKWSNRALGWIPSRVDSVWNRLYAQLDRQNIFNPFTLLHLETPKLGYKTHPQLEQRRNHGRGVAEEIMER